MKMPWDDRIRIFLGKKLFTSICGMTLGDWLHLLWKHRFAIDPPYWPRAAFMTGTSLMNSVYSWHENRVYGSKVIEANIKPPLFILGHWRSGTTHLHNILAVDKQFAYPNVYQALNPHAFLSTEGHLKFIKLVSPKTRVVDNMSFNLEMPFEEEFATCNATFHSPYMIWAFPQWEAYYDKYLTFRGVPEEEVAAWKAALILFFKKLTWKYDRPLLLKSPPHTCRIKMLLDMFPEARFIHIYRHPYSIFQSTKHLVKFMLDTTCLQRPDLEYIDTRIMQRFNLMYDAFFEERMLIPDSRFHEVCFEELESDPMGQVKNIYKKLHLSGFDTVQPSLQCYIDSIANYRKNEHAELPSTVRRQVAQAWQRNFEEWGYEY